MVASKALALDPGVRLDHGLIIMVMVNHDSVIKESGSYKEATAHSCRSAPLPHFHHDVFLHRRANSRNKYLHRFQKSEGACSSPNDDDIKMVTANKKPYLKQVCHLPLGARSPCPGT